MRQVTGWLTCHPRSLDDEEEAQRAQILERCPELAALAGRVRTFAAVMTERQGHLLDKWIAATQASGLGPLAGFAHGLTGDYDAVRNGPSLPTPRCPVTGCAAPWPRNWSTS
ncbi:hypothetical protein KDK95_18520 [Actinospica sp. MGRD01-02]|uniref:Transposase n=1 Tax=Actinospica acidithermotolerans TaxID=2828514 RepID=A0A941IKP8_9ACTN|nr:hypothetical protein [Actinospica acidithermotolerans]MBR7828313.1 hypothetical protein [Actinospica acidithermotolerans]